MDFTTKKNHNFGGTLYVDREWAKPLNCPVCHYGTDAPVVGCTKLVKNDGTLFIAVALKCTHCSKVFISMYDATETDIAFIDCHPRSSSDPIPSALANLSPRFVELHEQAQTADKLNLVDIAAIGYRASLEVLVKDYAIKELNEPEEEVKSKKLAAAISAYLHQEELVKTADVVRILGNDYAHFEKKFPEHDFEVLKQYYSIFLDLIKTQMLIRHPPVERRS